MKILVTGGLGFIGKSLTSKLLKNKENAVYILDNFQNGKRDRYTNGATIIKGDVRNQYDWENISQVDYIYHLAAPSSVILFNKYPTESINTTIQGFLNCINWSLKNKVKKIIYASSGSVYGNIKENCSEAALPSPINAYGKTKLLCENIAKLYDKKIPILGLRIFAGFGPQEDQKGNFASVITLFYQQIIAGQNPVVFGDGSQKRDFIYIDDIVNILIICMNDRSQGILNVGSGASVSFNYIIKMLNVILKSNIKPHYVSSPPYYLLQTRADISKLKEKYSNIIPFKEGLKRYIKVLNSGL